MIPTIVISSITMVILITMIIIKPSITLKIKNKTITIQTFWIISLLGALILIISALIF